MATWGGAYLCETHWGTQANVVDGLIKTRRLSLSKPTGAREFVPAVGMRVRGQITRTCATVIGVTSKTVTLHYDDDAVDNVSRCAPEDFATQYSTAPAEPEMPAVEYYGTMPNPLPETLPAGTIARPSPNSPYSCTLLEQGTLEPYGSGHGYSARFRADGCDLGTGLFKAADINWKTVRRESPAPPEKPAQPAAAKPKRCKRCTVEEYEPGGCVITENGLCGHCECDLMNDARCSHPRRFRSGLCVQCGHVGPGEAVEGYAIPSPAAARRPAPYGPRCHVCGQETTALGYAGNPHCTDCQCGVADQICGKGDPQHIDRRIAAAKSELDDGKARREAVSAHPRAWPEGAHDGVSENYSTHGSSGR